PDSPLRERMAAVFREPGAGMLVHPVWQAERVYFVSLTVTEEPLPDYVRYSFVFWEDWGGYDGGLTESGGRGASQTGSGTDKSGYRDVYIVKKGDTLWGIAKRHQAALTALIAANPQIKNPNLIYPGDRVNIP
ncbi:MAG: SafA/ExsA family spore coat assembly protein, partial [Oscillospiraceae bacterium]|nr:SafA/ExsA family spore coat assembly protein [Oscillospiraceae bacterium]